MLDMSQGGANHFGSQPDPHVMPRHGALERGNITHRARVTLGCWLSFQLGLAAVGSSFKPWTRLAGGSPSGRVQPMCVTHA